MCMDSVTKLYKRPSPKVVYGYKVFDDFGGKYEFEFRKRWPVITGKWTVATQRPLGMYMSGFHAFLSRKGAERWAGHDQHVVRVKLRRIAAEGLQYGALCIVAREMYVPRKRNARK
jgi:hypothetical protein